MTARTNASQDAPQPAARMLRRLGAAGFAFFLIKGLMWLVVPAALWLVRG